MGPRLIVPLATVLVATSIVPLLGQAPPDQKPVAFEVASIKPNISGEQRSAFNTPGNRYIATNVTLSQLIAWAYGESGPPPELRADYQMSGGPSWKDSDRFDVDAIMTSDGTATPVPFLQRIQLEMLMMQTLLGERFKLSVHHEMRNGPIYSLVIANRDGRIGPQLRRSETDCNALISRGRINAAPPPPPPPASSGQVPTRRNTGGNRHAADWEPEHPGNRTPSRTRCRKAGG